MPKRIPVRRSAVLSDREIRVLFMVAAGWTRERISKELGAGPWVGHYVIGNLERTFQARNQAHLVALAFRRGILFWDEYDQLRAREGMPWAGCR